MATAGKMVLRLDHQQSSVLIQVLQTHFDIIPKFVSHTNSIHIDAM